MAVVTSARAGTVAVLTIDNPPVNALGFAVRSELKAALDAALADRSVEAVVIIGGGRTFVAGADITEFGKPRREPLTPALIAAIEAGSKPVVAAIHGFAFGGGLELAMGCHYRIAAPGAQVGQPEVKLGLLPGAGGTQRLPRLVALPQALEMIALGEPIPVKDAKDKGLIDEIASGDLRADAVAYAERLARSKAPLRRVRDLPVKEPQDAAFFAKFRADLARRKRGVIAPQRCIDAVEATALPFDQGLARERELFQELVNSEQGKAQRYFFFAEREAGKIPDLPAEVAPLPVNRAAVIGAGTMGGGIAMCFANVGIPVTLVETAQEALDRGLGIIRKNYEATAARGGLTAADVEKRMALIAPTLKQADIGNADLVIEAVFEDLALKKEIFAQLEKVARQDAIIASNTSYQDVNAIAAATHSPERVLGMHFFSPANVMRLVEVVRGAKTSKPALATAMAIARKIRKVPVPVGVCYGFVGNRMLSQRSKVIERLLLEGALPHEVDGALVEFGFPMGPFAAGDLAGLDVGWRARKGRGAVAPIADATCEAGRYGQKTLAGYYRYEKGSRTPIPDPEVEKIILEISRKQGINRRPITAAEIVERVLLPMINEGAKILEEGIALRSGDIDVIWVYGYGWPVHRGGPMFYADSIGLAAVREKLIEQSELVKDPSFAPAALIERLAKEGKSFAEMR